MKLKKAISCAVAAAMCMAFISGCGGSKKQDVVKIGLLAPLTGGNAALGVGMKNSGQLAVDQSNKSGKYPFKFELVTVDDAGDPSTAVAAMNKLIADKGHQRHHRPLQQRLCFGHRSRCPQGRKGEGATGH